jgi:hypothetical protein
MSWIDCTIVTNAFTTLYSSPPELRDVELNSVVLATSHGPTISLGIRLSTLPDRPVPVRWPKGYNRVGFGLVIYGIRSLRMAGWKAINTVSIDIVRQPDGLIELTATDANGVLLACVGELAQIEKADGCLYDATLAELPG